MKQVTFSFILCFIVFPFLQSCHWVSPEKTVEGNHLIVNHLIDVKDFSGIRMDCFGEIIYKQIPEEEPYFQITTDENILPYLDLRVENNCLIISRKDTVIAPSKLTVYTNSKNLTRITLSDSASIHLAGEVNALQMDMCLTEKAKIVADSLLCREIRVEADGFGEVKLIGAATQGCFRTKGNAAIDLNNFFVEHFN
jgi:hypothetical protein